MSSTMKERKVGIAEIVLVSIILVVNLEIISGDANRLSNIIYTQKDVYALGETVSITVLNLNTLETSNNDNGGDANYTLIVSDSKQNIIVTESGTLTFRKSYLQNVINIGTHANLGHWNVQLLVKSSRNSSTSTTHRKQFEVRAVRAPYLSIQISPKYNFSENKSMRLSSPNRYSAILTVSVSAVHQSGVPIIGQCKMTVRIIDDCGNRFLPKIFPELTSEFGFEGIPTIHSVDVTPYIANDKHPARKDLRDSGGIFEIVLKVTDKFTGQEITEVTRTTFSSRDGEKIQEFSSFRVRRPGLPFIADFRLLDKAGNLVAVNDSYEFNFPIAGSTQAKFRQGFGSITVPESNKLYRISSRKIALIRNIANITNEASDYLQIRLLDMATNEIYQNALFKVQVMSTISIDVAHIVIYSGGKLIFSETRSTSNSKNFQIDAIFPNNSWREATLAVFANASGKYISDAISLTVANWTQKASDDVRLSFSTDTAEPDQNIQIMLQVKPGSIAYIHITDMAFEDPDEFASEKWLQSESEFILGGTNDVAIRDWMTTEQIARILADQVNQKKETGENPTCKDKPKKVNPRRRVLAVGLIAHFNENNTLIQAISFPDDEVTWRIKGFVAVQTSEESRRRIEFLPPALVRISKPIKILIELPVSLVKNEKLVVPILISHTANDPKNVTEVRIVMKHVDTNDTKIGNCTRVSDNSQIKYDCPMQFTHIGRYSVVLEAEIQGDALKKSKENLLHVKPFGREKFDITAVTHHTSENKSPLCLTTVIENDSSQISKKNVIPILTLSSSFISINGEYRGDRPESSTFSVGSLESNLLKLTAYSLLYRYQRTVPQINALYQSILSFKRQDGSFAEFGEKSTNGSIWLTAWVVQTLVFGYSLISPQPNVILGALNYLKNSTDSSFVGRHPGLSMRFDDAKNDPKDLALAAYVLVTFLKASEFVDPNNSYNGTIEKAREYLRNNFNSSDASLYAKTWIAFSEHVWEERNPAGRSERARYMKALWESPLGKYTSQLNKDLTTQTLRMEFHSYMVFLNYDKKFDISVIQQVLNHILWGLKSPSGYFTTFETATAISAMIEVLLKKSYYVTNYQLSVVGIGPANSTETLPNKFFLAAERSKRYVLPKGTKQVCIHGDLNHGHVIAQLGHSYYEDFRNISGQFHLTFDTELTNAKGLKMKFSARKKGQARSKMAVAEVNLPSGYNFIQPQTNSELKNVSSVKTWKYLDANSKLEIYFESVPQDVSIDFNLFAGKRLEVTNLAPVVVRIYEFNNPTDESQVIYGIP